MIMANSEDWGDVFRHLKDVTVTREMLLRDQQLGATKR